MANEAKVSSARAGRTPLQSSSLDAPKIKAYLDGHDVKPILDYLTALQLNPGNHGKYLRVEHLCQMAVLAIWHGNKTPDLKAFKRLIDEEYPYDVMEDIPMNMFCETVVFRGEKYTFFPRLSTNAVELFMAVTESIYRVEDIFTEAFKKEIYQGVLLLELGSAMATRAGIGRMTRGSDSPRERIVFAGHVLASKGVKELVEACREIYNIKLEILGKVSDDGFREQLYEISGENSKSWLEIPGNKPFEEVIKEMKNCGIFVLPSYSEGFPNVILENMAYGCPIVATSVGAMPEMLDIEGENPCGICVSAKNVEELKNAVAELLDNPMKAEALGANARKRVNEQYAMPKCGGS